MLLLFTALMYLVVFLLLLILLNGSSRKGFWKQYGVPEFDTSRLVSDFEILLWERDITERDDYIYQKMGKDEKFCGIVERPKPILILKDLDMVKKIYIKNFDHFVDRRQFFGAAGKDSVLLKMLGNLKGDEWKGVRASVTPAFTTGKIRRMMDSINAVAKTWIHSLKTSSAMERGDDATGVKIDVYKCMCRYTADVIAAAIFGLEAGTVQNPDSIFSTMSMRLTHMSRFQLLKFTLSLRFPKMFRCLGIDFMDMEALHFFEKLFKEKLNERMFKGEKHKNRTDFLQLLVEARGEEQKEGVKPEMKHSYLTDEVMSGQCLSFFFAGFRTTSTFLTFAVYALALHPEIQSKLREEVIGVFKEDGTLDYDDLGRLEYLDMVLCEVLRKFPATLRLERECVSDFHDRETGITIPKGTFVTVPLYSIHNDKEFYDNPSQFDPNHFASEKKGKRNPYAFIPGGIGGRSCIGMRFALTESKAAVAYLVRNFLIQPTETTPVPLTGKRVNFQIAPPDNLELKLIPI